MYSIGPQEDVKSLWDIAPISIVEPLNRWESLLELICSYKEGPLKYCVFVGVICMYREGPLNMLVFVLGSIYI